MEPKTHEYYCTRCKKMVPASEVEIWETYYEGEFDDAHIKCGGKATIQFLSGARVPKAVHHAE